MPLVRIDMIEGRSEAQVAAIGGCVQRALVECMNVPARDRFEVIAEHAPGRLAYNAREAQVRPGDVALPKEEWK